MRKKAKHESQPPFAEHCAVQGCPFAGEYKAPTSRDGTGTYQYLCLDHVREFNQAWDYFNGWGRDQIEHFMHSATYGHRPTWKMGTGPVFTSEHVYDSFLHMMGEGSSTRKKHAPVIHLPQNVREAYALLDMEHDATLQEVKNQYKKLVKKTHPDVNKNPDSEEAFKAITVAYALLVEHYGKPHET